MYGSPKDLNAAAKGLTDRLISMPEPPILGHAIEIEMRTQGVTRRSAAQVIFGNLFGGATNPQGV